MALRAVCTTKLRAASCTTLKYASPSKYTSRWRAPNRTGTRSRLSALSVISVPSSSRKTARRHRRGQSRRPPHAVPKPAPGSVGVVGRLVVSRVGGPGRLQRDDRGAALRVSAQPRLDGGALLRGGLPVQVAAERDEVDRHHVVMTPQQGGLLTGRRHDLPEDR